MARKVKKTKKGKTIITQKVIVNVSKGGRSRKPSGPPQPTQAERIIQMLAPIVRQQPMIQPNPPIQPSQITQQSLEAILQRLIPKEGPRGPPGPQGEMGPIFNFDMDASMKSSDSRASLDSFAFDMSGLDHSGREYVLDQPDAPLVGPAQPAFAGGPQRLDPVHEDVPLRELGVDEEGVGEGKQPEQEDRFLSIEDLSDSILTDEGTIDLKKLSKITLKKKKADKPGRIYLRDITNSLGITMPRGKNTDDYRDAIRRYYQQL